MWKHGYVRHCQISQNNLERNKWTILWYILAEFEWDGKLLRYKTGIQIGKQNPRIIHTWFFFSSTQAVVLQMELWSTCIEDKLFQVSGHLDNAKVRIWRKKWDTFPILDAISSVNWRLTWHSVVREFVRELKIDLAPYWTDAISSVRGSLTWHSIVVCSTVRPWIEDWLGTKLEISNQTGLAMNSSVNQRQT